MMTLRLQTARHVHAVRTPEQLEAKQRAALRQQAEKTGDPVTEPWPADGVLEARVNHGTWLGDCVCGSGVAVEPVWPLARCFACGAVYQVLLPSESERAEIADVLGQRRRGNQHWLPGESVADLVNENTAHGLPARGGERQVLQTADRPKPERGRQ